MTLIGTIFLLSLKMEQKTELPFRTKIDSSNKQSNLSAQYLNVCILIFVLNPIVQ